MAVAAVAIAALLISVAELFFSGFVSTV